MKPNNLHCVRVHQGEQREVLVLGDNDKIMNGGVFKDLRVRGTVHASVAHMHSLMPMSFDPTSQSLGEMIIDQKVQAA